MLVFPAVDIRGGRCVRLDQGRADAEKVYYERPLDAALHWQQLGAEALHVVNLDGAFGSAGANAECIRRVLGTLSIPVQAGGGLRSEQDVELLLHQGAARAVVGTRAATEPRWATDLCRRFPDRIVVALDARDGKVAIKGWLETSGLSVLELARTLADGPPAAFLYTDISRDGMMSRPNFDAVARLVEGTNVPVIASGGVASVADIAGLGECGAHAVIVGKAFYEGRLTLPDAIEAASAYPSRLAPRPAQMPGSGR